MIAELYDFVLAKDEKEIAAWDWGSILQTVNEHGQCAIGDTDEFANGASSHANFWMALSRVAATYGLLCRACPACPWVIEVYPETGDLQDRWIA